MGVQGLTIYHVKSHLQVFSNCVASCLVSLSLTLADFCICVFWVRNIDLQSIFQIRLLKVVWTLIFFIFFLILPVSYIPENWFFQFSGKKTDKKESGDMLSGLDGSSYVKFPSLSLICDAIYILPRAAD